MQFGQYLVERRKVICQSLRSRFVGNLIQIYCVQISSFLLPLVTIPLLARVLGASGVGILATFQSLAFLAATISEYGFVFSATRRAAAIRHDELALGKLLSSVVAAKAAILSLICLLLFVSLRVVPALHSQNVLTMSAMLYAFGMSMNASWFFQATDQLRTSTICDLLSKLLASGIVVLCVRQPSQLYLALAIPGASLTLGSLAATILAFRKAIFVWPNFASIATVLNEGSQLFITRCIGSAISSGNALLLAFFVDPRHVGYFAGADRVLRASLAAVYPFSQLMYPKIATLVGEGAPNAKSVVIRSLQILGTAAFALWASIFCLAPTIVHLALGIKFEPAIVTLRILSFVPLLRAISDVLGIQWLIVNGLEASYNRCLMLAALANCFLAFALSKSWAENGMALSVLGCESVLAFSVWTSMHLNGLSPFKKRVNGNSVLTTKF